MRQPAELAELRAAIDRIDDRIADLLIERLGVVREVGRVKGDMAAGRLALRLAREAQMMRRLLERTAGRFPPVGVLRIWREIIANSTQIEAPFDCLVDARGGVVLHDLARDQVGSATPIVTVEHASAALQSLRQGGARLAVLAPPTAAQWWPDELPDGVQIVARLPLTATDGAPQGFVAAPLQAEPSGDDRTLYAVRLAATADPAYRRLGHDGSDRYLVELDGFASAAPSADWRRLGCYAAPLAVPEGPRGDHA